MTFYCLDTIKHLPSQRVSRPIEHAVFVLTFFVAFRQLNVIIYAQIFTSFTPLSFIVIRPENPLWEKAILEMYYRKGRNWIGNCNMDHCEGHINPRAVKFFSDLSQFHPKSIYCFITPCDLSLASIYSM